MCGGTVPHHGDIMTHDATVASNEERKNAELPEKLLKMPISVQGIDVQRNSLRSFHIHCL